MFRAFVFLICFISLPLAVRAQDVATASAPAPTPDLVAQYFTDLNFQQNQYQKDYLNYVAKSKVHTTYRTITTQKERLEATRSVLITRNNLLKTYLMYLRVLLTKHSVSSPTETERLQIELSKWEAYFDEQNSIVTSLNNESDISTWSADFASKYITVQQLLYTTLVQQEINQRTEVTAMLQTLTSQIQNSGKISTDTQWFSDLPIKFDLVTQSLTKAAATSVTRQNNPTRFYNFYPDAKVELNKAKNYLTQIASDLKVIVIKNWQ
ncbi:MAG: hypothetical protein WCT01_01780 [Candidatus Shapirobacteria bacterium]